jgi:hypothetical protein
VSERIIHSGGKDMLWCDFYNSPCLKVRDKCLAENNDLNNFDSTFCECVDCCGSFEPEFLDEDDENEEPDEEGYDFSVEDEL